MGVATVSNAKASGDARCVDWGNTKAYNLKHRIHEIEPLLKFKGAFELSDTHLDDNEQELLLTLRDYGALEQTQRWSADHKAVNEYRWNESVRQAFRDYLEDMDEMPCPGENHRLHIADSRGVPDGEVTCKFCREEGREWSIDKERLKEYL